MGAVGIESGITEAKLLGSMNEFKITKHTCTLSVLPLASTLNKSDFIRMKQDFGMKCPIPNTQLSQLVGWRTHTP